MQITTLQIKGFRNFVDETISFDNKTLIIGGNDTGKSNLIYALRILFDPSLSSRDFELGASDFNIQSHANTIEITAKLEDIHEDCLNSILQGAIEDGISYIRYTIERNGDYSFFTGHSEEALVAHPGRPYIKHLMLEYISSSRNLSSFLKRQQKKLLDIARDQRNDEQTTKDEIAIQEIQESLLALNEDISDLNYVSNSLDAVNEEMTKLSIGNEGYTARFVAGNTDADKLLDNLQLAYLLDNEPLVFGGEGRGNQLYFATWASEQKLTRSPEKVVIFAIEEPEAHLHPHQQRQLAEYLSSTMDGQVLITSHSPQIVERFSTGKILRIAGLTSTGKPQRVYGCSASVDAAFDGLGYRLNAISSEVFFSNGVLLVEGPSERIFYTALSRALNKSFDRLNISILSVDGVGFSPYVRACISLGIPFSVRTDNDVFGLGKNSSKRLAGVKRLIDIANKWIDDSSLKAVIAAESDHLSWDGTDEIPKASSAAQSKLEPLFEKHGLFLSEHRDLEEDLAYGPLRDNLLEYYGISEPASNLVEIMQQRKAENMHDFIASGPSLSLLADSPIAEPLKYISEQVEGRRN